MDDDRILVIDFHTNKIIEYDHIWLHTKPEEGMVSLYNGGIGDSFRTIFKIKNRVQEPLTTNLKLWVVKF